jgi:hypothetical protein
MRRLPGALMLASVLAVSVGCYSAPVMPPVGGLYSDIKAPLTTEFTGQGAPTKSGEAASMSVLGLFSWGDCSLASAAAAGNLSTIDYCDYAYQNVVLGVYQRFTVVAHGR